MPQYDAILVGNSSDETLTGITTNNNQINGAGGNDTLNGGGGTDFLIGGIGSDQLNGGDGDDILIGDGGSLAETRVKITFDGETAGYRNSFGVYQVDPKTGEITDVVFGFENASQAGLGGDLIPGEASFEYAVAPGADVGAFLISNGFSLNNFADFDDSGHFEFRDSNGNRATLETQTPTLVYVAEDGSVTSLNGPVYHTAGYGDHLSLNADGLLHTDSVVANGDGTYTISMEDLYNLGDADFTDIVFTYDMQNSGAALVNAHTEIVSTSVLDSSGNADDILNGGAGNDQIFGGMGNDILNGGAGADHLSGGDGDDTLYAGSADTVDGGNGTDTLIVNDTAFATYDPENSENGTVYFADGGTLTFSNIEVLQIDTLLDPLTLRDDVIMATTTGSSVFDLLANDTELTGSDIQISRINGLDVTVGQFIALTDQLGITLNVDGTLQVQSTALSGSVSFTYSAANSDGVYHTATAIIHSSPVDGTEADDSMQHGYVDADGNAVDGADGNNEVVLGYGGNDKIFTGAGDDWIYGGTGNDFIRAETGNDTIEGGIGNDVLDGGAGADEMIGGVGNDVYYIDNLDDTILENSGEGIEKVVTEINYTLGNYLENLWLKEGALVTFASGNELDNMLRGNSGDNTLTGNIGDDRMYGLDGRDVLNGNQGQDRLEGGNGNDELYGHTDDDKLFGGGGNDELTGGDGNDHLRGGTGDDNIYGGSGNDFLKGGAGIDTLYGGNGDDTYFVSDGANILHELSENGVDTAVSKIDYTLGVHMENLKLANSDAALNGAGNNLDNLVRGNSYDNDLSGHAGHDKIYGRRGNDTLAGGTGNDRLIGGGGADTLLGNAGQDRLNGGAGDDILEGGTGNDLLNGKSGADEFRFQAGDGQDKIFGFTDGVDMISFTNLSYEDLTITQSGNRVEIEYGENDSIVLLHSSNLDITSDDFIFV